MLLTQIDHNGRQIAQKDSAQLKPYAKNIKSFFFLGGYIVAENGKKISCQSALVRAIK